MPGGNISPGIEMPPVQPSAAAKPKPKAKPKPAPQPTEVDQAVVNAAVASAIRDELKQNVAQANAAAAPPAATPAAPIRTPNQAATDLKAFLQKTKRFGSPKDRPAEVQSAQRDLGVKADGIVGPITRAAARKAGVVLPAK